MNSREDSAPGVCYRVPDWVLAQRVGDETVLLNMESGKYFSLDESATEIWCEVEGGRDPGAIVDLLLERHEVDRERAAADVRALLESAAARGLLIEG